MAEYKLEVTTGDMTGAGTYDYIYVTLIGTEGESERTELNNYGVDFASCKTGSYTVKTKPLGQLLLIKVEKDPYLILPENEWFCSKIWVTTPENDIILFPCHRWVSRGEHVELRRGTALKVFEEDHPLLIEHRQKELEHRGKLYQWQKYADGLPYIIGLKTQSELPHEIRFSLSRGLQFTYSIGIAKAELNLKGLTASRERWENMEAFKKVFSFYSSPVSEYVSEHWMEDDFYGYQFLNGVNPTVIQRCSELPSNFPVTEEMVQPFLEDGSSLRTEMKKGNIFLCDYKIMEGLPTRVVKGEPLPLTAALCLLYVNSKNQLKPIAIQLGQQPSDQNSIFLPSDPEHDWLLAKMFVKNADALLHEVVAHLLNTHLLAEVFAIASLRSFPVVHPLYKLLIPHFRYTVQINSAARAQLLAPDGLLAQSTLGGEGLIELIKRYHAKATYSALCLPDVITARGLEAVPNFYYRDDGLKLWNIISSFVKAMLEQYYTSDSEVTRDSELQRWINEIFTRGFPGNSSSGIPGRFITVEEVIKFVTMVIFRISAEHSAVNNGQFDYCSWFPNSPLMLRKAPPTTKGQATMETVLETLADVGDTVGHIAATWILSKKFADFVPLGTYPDERFEEPGPKQIIREFQAELSRLSEEIAKRNSNLELPYTYLNPVNIENSVSI
ncbi:hydroperoxide isomerase ALOXE3-like [Polymixia lowei]